MLSKFKSEVVRGEGGMWKRHERCANCKIIENFEINMAINKITSKCPDQNSVSVFCKNKCANTNKGHYHESSTNNPIGAIYECGELENCGEELRESLKEQKVLEFEMIAGKDTGEEGTTLYLTFDQPEVPDFIKVAYHTYEVHKITTNEKGEKEEKMKRKKKRKKKKEKEKEENQKEKKEENENGEDKENEKGKNEGKKGKTSGEKRKRKSKRKGKEMRWNTEKERQAGRVKFKESNEEQPQRIMTARRIEAGNVKTNPPKN